MDKHKTEGRPAYPEGAHVIWEAGRSNFDQDDKARKIIPGPAALGIARALAANKTYTEAEILAELEQT